MHCLGLSFVLDRNQFYLSWGKIHFNSCEWIICMTLSFLKIKSYPFRVENRLLSRQVNWRCPAPTHWMPSPNTPLKGQPTISFSYFHVLDNFSDAITFLGNSHSSVTTQARCHLLCENVLTASRKALGPSLPSVIPPSPTSYFRVRW